MPGFICDICGCLDNTALGLYWGRDTVKIFAAEFSGKALCTECVPTVDAEGNPIDISFWNGKWHGEFEKKSWKDWGYPEVVNRTKLERVTAILTDITPKSQRPAVSLRGADGKLQVVWLDELSKLTDEQMDALITLYGRKP